MNLPEHLQAQIATETRYLRVRGEFALESGEVLRDVEIAYRTWGDPANAKDHAILICHALTGSADVNAWWPDIIGEGKTFDPTHDYIVCANILGSCYGTTGPVSFKPGTAQRYRADFPQISVRDMVELERVLLDELGVEHIDWNGGYYTDEAPPEQGLAAARMMAVCTYRSWQSFDQRFGRDKRDAEQYEVQSYLRHQGRKINHRFDANTYVTLTHAMHSHDLARDRGNYADVLRTLKQPALVISVSSDALYPPEEQRYLADHLPNAQYEILECLHGHDGFLIETESLGRMIVDFRAGRSTGSRLRVVSSGCE
jgi:homoserine O-acetyltransferase